VYFGLEQAHALAMERLHLQRGAELERQKREAGSTVLATVSHEMRTPLHAILACLTMLMDTPMNADQLELAKMVSDGSNGLLTLINDVLDLSKLELGTVELERKRFSLRGCVPGAAGGGGRRGRVARWPGMLARAGWWRRRCRW
jgi:signal transduction histidine kinase